MDSISRDRLAPLFREQLLDITRKRPFPHQAAFWASLDGWLLTDKVVEQYDLPTLDLDPYFEARSPIPHGTTDVFVWSADEADPQYRIERRELTPRTDGNARFAADLASYKGGKSWQGGLVLAADLMVPGTEWDIIGMQYTICEPEFNYVADLLLGDDGLNLPVKGRDGFNGRMPDGSPYPSLWCTTYQNSVGVGRMKIALSNGSCLEAKSWESGEGLKGKERAGYLYAEAYQFGNIKPFATLKQNLQACDGKAIFATTPDDPWVDVLREMGESEMRQHRKWFCIGNVAREENPYTFDADEKEADASIMTREQHAIAWEGRLGTYVGSVFEYTRDQRIFTPQTHPDLFVNPGAEPTLENLYVPPTYRVVGGADTGTYSAACWAMFSDEDPATAFFIGEVCNYRYVATQIEQTSNYSMLNLYDDIKNVSDKIGARYVLYADPNSQFKNDAWVNGIRISKGSDKPEQRTERLRALFQHDRIFFAPWLKILPYECELAKYPPEETSTGRWRRIKERDHCLDGAEHICAIDPSGRPVKQGKQQLAIETILGVKQKMPTQPNPWNV